MVVVPVLHTASYQDVACKAKFSKFTNIPGRQNINWPVSRI